MSRFRFRVQLDNITRVVEIERQKYDLVTLREKASKAFNIPGVNLRYTAPSGESYFITNDQQLQKAIKEAEKSGARFVQVQAYRDSGAPSGYSAAAPSAASQPRAVAASAPTQASAPLAAARPATTSAVSPRAPAPAGILTSYKLLADTSSSADRVAVDAQQSADHFLFSLKPSKFDTDVDVKLDGTSLLFLTTHSVTEGNTIKTIKGTQGISLPFAPTSDSIQVMGQQIKVSFPK